VTWKPIQTAPRDGTEIQVRIPGHGDDNVVAWLRDTVEGTNGPCGCWMFTRDQEPPQDWSDGYCWAINEDGERSTWPTEWKMLPITAPSAPQLGTQRSEVSPNQHKGATDV